MTRAETHIILPGTVVEFFESREILCGVVLAVTDGRMHVLTEKNREINLTRSRIVHHGDSRLGAGLSRDDLVRRLAEISEQRKEIQHGIDLEELWSLLNEEEADFDSLEIAEFLYTRPVADNLSAAVNRVLLEDKLFFNSKDYKFVPRRPEEVEQRRADLEREAEKERRLSVGARWIEALWNRKPAKPPSFRDELINYLKDYAVFGQEAREALFVKEVLKRAGAAPQPLSAFRLLVRLGVWSEDENLLLHEHGISPSFTAEELESAAQISARDLSLGASGREDLTELPAFTVDSNLTRDYDDALSIREAGGGTFEVGVHIADAAEFVARDGPLDRSAEQRASSIYLPDLRVSMLPPLLSEGIFSLKAGEDRLALSFIMRFDGNANLLDSRIVPSAVRIRRQLTYNDADSLIAAEPGMNTLYQIALKRRQRRLDSGAIILPLPEIHVYVNDAGMIQVARYEKENPSQIMVSEWMIEANAAAAEYLAKKGTPAIFRGQGECRPETEFVQTEHEIFRAYRQRRLFSRAELSPMPLAHCSLALQSYSTVTSPIRRYSDLVVQRQLKNALTGNPNLYSKEELDQIITRLAAAQARVFTIQRKWTRYWILKYIEQEDLETMNALVLDKNARFSHLLVPEFLLEVNAPVPENATFRQGEMVRIRLEKVSPRDDILKIQILETPAR